MTYKPFEFIDSAAARNMLWFLKVRDPWWVVAGAGAVVVANLPYCSFEPANWLSTHTGTSVPTILIFDMENNLA